MMGALNTFAKAGEARDEGIKGDAAVTAAFEILMHDNPQPRSRGSATSGRC